VDDCFGHALQWLRITPAAALQERRAASSDLAWPSTNTLKGELSLAAERIAGDSSRGKNGGRAVRDKYGVDFFREIGRKGGNSLKERGANYVELGRMGGEVTKARHGSDHYSEIGRKGGRNGRGASKKGSGRRKTA
jgi:general stress protein YciG